MIANLGRSFREQVKIADETLAVAYCKPLPWRLAAVLVSGLCSFASS